MPVKKIVDMSEKEIIFMIRMKLSYYENDQEKRDKATQRILKLIHTKKRTWDFEVSDIDHNTMLSYAAYNQSLPIVKALIDKGAILEREKKQHYDRLINVPQAIEACIYNKNMDVLNYLFPLIQKRESFIGAITTSYIILYPHAQEKREFIYKNTDIKPHEVFEDMIIKNWPDLVSKLIEDKYPFDLKEMRNVYDKYKKTHHLDTGKWKEDLSHFMIMLEKINLDSSIKEIDKKITKMKL
jgi:hypothetical protein